MKVTKKELQRAIQRQESRIDGLVGLLAKKGYYDKEPEPQLKQLDQSVFDGLDDDIICAVVKSNGEGMAANKAPFLTLGGEFWGTNMSARLVHLGGGYDTSDWQNSLIERDIAKELLEVDLSGELTGSELCKAMIIGDRDWVLAYVSNENDAAALFHKNAMVVTDFDLSEDAFYCRGENFAYAVPINNQGEPLTAAEAGF